MKTEPKYKFTYEEVRQALEKAFHVELEGVRVHIGIGYLVESCFKSEQPIDPSDARAIGKVLQRN